MDKSEYFVLKKKKHFSFRTLGLYAWQPFKVRKYHSERAGSGCQVLYNRDRCSPDFYTQSSIENCGNKNKILLAM